MQNQVTSINELKGYMQGEIVELPPFADGQTFVAKLKRPSLLTLVKNGKIPNTLLKTANDLFYGNVKDDEIATGDTLAKIFNVFDIICEASFVEPTYKQMKEANIELTDDQLMFVFNYSQQGVKALEPFRK